MVIERVHTQISFKGFVAQVLIHLLLPADTNAHEFCVFVDLGSYRISPDGGFRVLHTVIPF